MVKALEQDYSKSRCWLTRAANKGEAHAQFWLGKMFEFGIGIEGDKGKAAVWYENAALQGTAEAQNALGLCLFNSDDKKNFETGLEGLEKAAAQRYPDAQYNLAVYRQKQKFVET